MRLHRTLLWTAIACLTGSFLHPAQAHVGQHPSVHDTVASVLRRLETELGRTTFNSNDFDKVLSTLRPEERHALGTEHVSFRVNVPVRIGLLRSTNLTERVFWLADQGFQPTGAHLDVAGTRFELWERQAPAGPVGLGINSIAGGGWHYIPIVRPVAPDAHLVVEGFYPGQLRSLPFREGTPLYADDRERAPQLPSALDGWTLVQVLNGRRNDGQLMRVLRRTAHPATAAPDQITLTWSGDPRTTQTLQWRTSAATGRGWVAYQKKALFNRFQPSPLLRRPATTERLVTPNVLNDPVVHRHAVTLTGLDPGATYVYSVGDGSRDGWTERAEFTTAPDDVRPFSFIYMGDAQNGLERWGSLMQTAFRNRPDAAFYIMAGDLVNRGNDRDDWDSFFDNARGIYDRRTLVPVLGNHECQGGHPSLYLRLFGLPDNGPSTLESGRAYSFRYSNALFVVLDSNKDAASQTPWLEAQLAGTDAKWKFVAYHHPAYSSGVKRDNPKLRNAWTPIFDKYHVDMALQGHDHAYLRTYPLKASKRVGSPKDGTVYVVSVSGTKFYAQDPRDYTEFGMTNTATYQVLDIQISGDRLVYRAYDSEGRLRDELIIQK